MQAAEGNGNMFENYAKSYLHTKSSHVIYSKVLRFWNWRICFRNRIARSYFFSSQSYHCYLCKGRRSKHSCFCKAKDEHEAKQMIYPVVQEIKSRLNPYLYSENNEELVEVVAKKLLEKNITISLAESCTGGLIASELTSISGISKSFDRGIVTYSNISKVEQLGVNPSTLENLGQLAKKQQKKWLLD